MNLNVTDALDSYLTAKFKVGNWETEFNARFYAPVLKTMVGNAIRGAKNSPQIDQDKLKSGLSPEARARYERGR